MSEKSQPDHIDRMISRLEQLSISEGTTPNNEGPHLSVDYTNPDLPDSIIADNQIPLPRGTKPIGNDTPEITHIDADEQRLSATPLEPKPFDFAARANEEAEKNRRTELNLLLVNKGDRLITRRLIHREDGSILIRESVFDVISPPLHNLQTPGSYQPAVLECVSGAEDFIGGLSNGDTIMIDGSAFGSAGSRSNTITRNDALRIIYTFQDGRSQTFTTMPIDTFSIESDPTESNRYEPVPVQELKERYKKRLRTNTQLQQVQSSIQNLANSIELPSSFGFFTDSSDQPQSRISGMYPRGNDIISLEGINKDTKRKILLRQGNAVIDDEKIYYVHVDEDYKDGIQRDYSSISSDYVVSNGPANGSLIVSLDNPYFKEIGLDQSILNVKCIVNKKGEVSFDFFSSLISKRADSRKYKGQIELIRNNVTAEVKEDALHIRLGEQSFTVPLECDAYIGELFDLVQNELKSGNVTTYEKE